MNPSKIAQELQKKFPRLSIKTNEILAPYTTFKIGGPVEIFITTESSNQLKNLLVFIKTSYPRLPITILGNASNLLIADSGLKGLVIKNNSQNIKILSLNLKTDQLSPKKTISNRRTELDPEKYLDFSSLNYDESTKPQVLVEIESGAPLPYALAYLFKNKITGLQWFAGIPGTFGGATWYNIHGGTYHLSDFIKEVTTLNLKTGKEELFQAKDLDFSYDYSVFQKKPHLVILSTTLSLYRGDTEKARITAQKWINQKAKCQPLPSAGSVFQNLDSVLVKKHGFKNPSVGWIIDQLLNLKGKTIGGAQISPLHANFIVNQKNATAKDVLSLIELIKKEFKKRWNIDLKLEIKILGNI